MADTDRLLDESLAILNADPSFEPSSGMPMLPTQPLRSEPPPPDDWLTMPVFHSVANADHAKLHLLLASGADPNAVLPTPPPLEFAQQFRDAPLDYYVQHETGFTALMLASAIGDEQSVHLLLLAGADRNQLSSKHKTFALYLAAKAGHIDVMRQLMGITPDSSALRYMVHVDLSAQKAVLFEDQKEILVTAISSGKKSKTTPKGVFLVTNKYRHWKSTIYNTNMPYFLRLSCSDFGFHAGRLPGYPASSGCIRLPSESAKIFFATLPVGTLVQIE